MQRRPTRKKSSNSVNASILQNMSHQPVKNNLAKNDQIDYISICPSSTSELGK